MTNEKSLFTPDVRYLVVRGRLWRARNPALTEDDHEALVHELMDARRAVGAGLRKDDAEAVRAARGRVDKAKVRLGERGPVWWTDGAPDENRKMVAHSSYADWYAARAETRKAGST